MKLSVSPQQLQTLAQEYVATGNQSAAALAAGIPRTTAQYHLHRDEIQSIIKDCQLQLISNGLKKSVENQLVKIEAGSEQIKKVRQGGLVGKGAIKLMELGHDAEKQLLQSVGIHNAHTQSLTLTQIMVDARSEMSPQVEALLSKHLSGSEDHGLESDDDVIDINKD